MNSFNPLQYSTGKNFTVSPPQQISTEQMCPIFSFRHLSRDYCISKCLDEEKVSFVNKMQKLSQMSWAQIKSAPKHGLGCEKINRKSLKAAIPPSVSAEVTFLAFRFYTKAAMVGYRDRDVFHIIIFDRNFKAYDHGS